MALAILDSCINCGVCVPECPNEAIEMGSSIYYIRAGKCTECVGDHDAPQCQSLCPIPDCIVVNPRRVETREQLELKHKRLQGNREFERALAKNMGKDAS